MRNHLLIGAAVAALSFPATAFAQSTGSVDFEEQEIVITGSSVSSGVAGIIVPDTSKAKAELSAEAIQQSVPGQSINEVINRLPGVSFQNNDAFGSAGGTMTIRGFDSTRISQTVDGIPLNDSGNYALYFSQQMDIELIERVSVNLGTTDVDSPTAAATGSTVNYRTRVPGEEFGAKLVGSVGEYGFFRVFGMVDSGNLTSSGLRAFISASNLTSTTTFYREGKIDRQQYNARLYQPLGDNGDFISIAGTYDVNRKNFFGSVALRNDLATPTPARFPQSKAERFYSIAPCLIAVGRPGIADTANSCGSEFDRRINPSNTGNIRGASRFTLADNLVLSIDPSFQVVKANGGGTATAREGTFNAGGTQIVGYIGGSPYYGRDLNGDGDLLDQVRVLAPSQTQTQRIGVISSLRWEMDDSNIFRLAYSYDRARHRQTGETNMLQANGATADPFPINDPLLDRNDRVLQKRDRLSFAILHQIAGEYRGEFGDLTVNVGLRLPFMRRNLTNYCATSSASGFVECFTGDTAAQTAWLAFRPTQTVPGVGTFPTQGPQQRIFNYKKVLPNIGLVYDLTSNISAFGNFSQGLQAPGTDNLYNSFYFPTTADQAQPRPEKTDNFDLGMRYRSSKVHAQVVGWYTNYTDRLASAYDPELDRTVYRNLGTVKKYGIDANISWQPISALSVYAFGSLLESEIKDNVLLATRTNGTQVFAPTAGKREAGAPTYTFGAGFNADAGPVAFGANVKRTGSRYVFDDNTAITTGQITSAGVDSRVQIYPAKTPAYTLVDLHARVKMDWAGLGEKTYFQFNVMNLFDELYVGGFSGNLSSIGFNATTQAITSSSAPFVQIGYPRTVMGSLVVGF
ncbi:MULTISPECIES: TonB-dependent receptor [unclassified Sphingomonas]|uniref:TonB-dependent receptor n=1 Tax=unclassified Sphingomonas TaxID=196159 RepID=UPI0021507D79|nr:MULTISPECIES: TonB-dependent receptor [unclassified Sphingomonas]MCR5872556.1 TonB-dependent receptor [Sphingomonas sp. J344]UUX99157.1 TonB-dependent receptor [Sphingomonas sp. J315]